MVTLLRTRPKSFGTSQYGYPTALSSQIDWHVRIWLQYCTFKLIGTLLFGYPTALFSQQQVPYFYLNTFFIPEYGVPSSFK
jgi:hypothetical protein